MKKRFVYILIMTLCVSLLSSCGKSSGKGKDSEYMDQMNNFFESVKTLDAEINALNPEDDESISELFVYLHELEDQFKYLADIDAPDEYNATESLADEAYDYMVQANQYFEASFSDNSYNEYTYAAGYECYKRANKRVHYIVALLHGEVPSDENVTVE